MFTGIITSLGTVVERTDHSLIIDAPGISEAPGESIAVDGCCLTVVESTPIDAVDDPSEQDARIERVRFDILPETLAHTRLGELQAGDAINLEPALRVGDPLGGHLVQGHVDGVGRVRSSVSEESGRWLDLVLDIPEDILRFCAGRGSITVNGVSLTIMDVDLQGISLQLIPETQARTNLGKLRIGASVNLEVDVIARYVERLVVASRYNHH